MFSAGAEKILAHLGFHILPELVGRGPVFSQSRIFASPAGKPSLSEPGLLLLLALQRSLFSVVIHVSLITSPQ